MNLVLWFDLFRVAAVSMIILIGFPVLVYGLGSRSTHAGWLDRIACAFVRAALFLQVTVLLLGISALCLPGMLAASYGGFLALSAFWHYRDRIVDARRHPRLVSLQVLEALEPGARLLLARVKQFRPTRLPLPIVLFSLSVLVIFLHRASYPVSNLRFVRMETYSRVLSLQMLTHGRPWQPDGSVALLAPTVFFGGMDAASVVRAAGPFFETLLAVSCAYTAFRFTGRASAAYIALVLAGLVAVLPVGPHALESGPRAMAALFWGLTLALTGISWRSALYSALAAILISPVPDFLWLAAFLFCIGMAIVLADPERWVPAPLYRPLRYAAAGTFVTVLTATSGSGAPDGPFQYESSAAVCMDIARQFRRNKWLIVSPVHELAFIYGKGWHVELLDFVAAFRPDQVKRADFVFPYDVKDVFVFIEKEPLQPGSVIRSTPSAFDLTQELDPAVISYGTASGRAAIQFQAARLISIYAATHSNVSPYFEDEKVIVFRIQNQTAAKRAVR